jgi:multimeric flavodoxin WrbA
MDVRPCIGCWKCLEMQEPGCVIEDDMASVYPLLRAADLIVFATPIYWWHIAGQMKVFLDRLEVVRYRSDVSHISGSEEKLEEARQLGRSFAGWRVLKLTLGCPVEGCRGMFPSVDSLARHMAAGAGLKHRAWRREHGLEDRGMADDELWKQIAEMLNKRS